MIASCSKCRRETAVEDLREGARCPSCGTVVELPAEFPTVPNEGRVERAIGRKLTVDSSHSYADLPSAVREKPRAPGERTQEQAALTFSPEEEEGVEIPTRQLDRNLLLRAAGNPARPDTAPVPPVVPRTRTPSDEIPTTAVDRDALAAARAAPESKPGASKPARSAAESKPTIAAARPLSDPKLQVGATRPLSDPKLQVGATRPLSDPKLQVGVARALPDAKNAAPRTPRSGSEAKPPAPRRSLPPSPPPQRPPAATTQDPPREDPTAKQPQAKKLATPIAARAPTTPPLPMGRPHAATPARPEAIPHDPVNKETLRTLGGYQIKRKLGLGGMGTVYLARQLSLDRDVAVKLLHPALSNDAEFLTRFTREAYAAAHLTHHNIVQIYDIGSEGNSKFYSMEFVDGPTLAAVVATKEKLDPEIAAGYVLQAARGLAFAHAQGMIHRDIKPDNLMLNDQGLIKVADLGLVKVDGLADPDRAPRDADSAAPRPAQPNGLNPLITHVHITDARSAMGTPAFMSPEQARDPTNVDGRADIYSLGCTLYYLLTGRPPFQADSDVALMFAHAHNPVTPPEAIVKRVPKPLSEIVLGMLAKEREERFQTMGEVAAALEGFLGVDGSKSFSPREEHAEILEAGVKDFNRSAWSRRRFWALLGYIVAWPLIAGATGWFFEPLVGATLGATYLLTLGSYFILNGVASRSYMFRLTREFIFGSRAWVLLSWLVLMAGAAALLVYLDLEWWGLGAILGAVAGSLALYFGIDRRVVKERKEPVSRVEKLLKSLRLRGLEESALRQFVCKYSGEHWEEFFEALFGYDAKVDARSKWGRTDGERPRKRFGAWRDPLIRFLESQQRRRAALKEKRDIGALEKKIPARGA